MLTPAQQKIRRELEELQLKGLLHDEKKEHPIIKRKTKTVWIFMSIAVLLLVSPLLVKPYYKLSGPVRANQYLLYVYRLEHKSSQLFEDHTETIGLNGTLGSDKKALPDLKELQMLVVKAKRLKAPSGFGDHKQDLIAVLEQRVAALKSPSKRNLVTLDVKKGLARDTLAMSLKKKKIKFRIIEDDTIQFWIDKKVYQY